MADSTSDSRKVVPLFSQDTFGDVPGGPGDGGGENYGPRIEKLEKDVSDVNVALNKINKNLDTINKKLNTIGQRTRYFNRSVSHRELLVWASLAFVTLCGAYAYITPIIIKAAQFDSINKRSSVILNENQIPQLQEKKETSSP